MPESHNAKTGLDPAAGLLHLVRQLQRLKRVPRQGWLDRGVPPLDTESVADHSFGVALLAWMAALDARAAGANLDPVRVLELALIHDMPEAEIGDWTPYTADDMTAHDSSNERAAFLNERQTRSPERSAAKRAAEQAVIDRLVAELPPAAGTALSGLWQELIEGQTPEARFMKQIDRLETFLQSREYLAEDPSRPMASFAIEASAEITDPLLASMRDHALADEEEG
jgi:putative hydrolase of HD superfamily